MHGAFVEPKRETTWFYEGRWCYCFEPKVKKMK